VENRMKHKTSQKMRVISPKHLAKDARLLLTTNTLFTLAIALSNTFVNVYLWKLEKDYILIGWFNFSHYFAIMLTYILAGKMAKKIDRTFILRLGVGVLAVFYLIVLLLGERTTDFYVLLGLILGVGQGFFWFSYDILYFEITEPENRDIFNGWNGLLTSLAGIIAPFLSGWFLARKTGVTGYKTVFFISLIIFVLAVIISLFFYKRKSTGRYRLNVAVSQAFQKSNWRYIVLGMMAQGGREGIIVFLIGILIYISTKSEFMLGSYTMIISAVSLVTYYVVGRFIKKNWRKHSMMVGTIMMGVAVVPMFLNINYTTLLIYGIGTSIFAPLYFIPLTSMIFDVIGLNEKTASLREEYIVVYDLGLNLGRLTMIAVFLGFVKLIGVEHLRFLLLLAGSLQIVTWLFMRNVEIGDNKVN